MIIERHSDVQRMTLQKNQRNLPPVACNNHSVMKSKLKLPIKILKDLFLLFGVVLYLSKGNQQEGLLKSWSLGLHRYWVALPLGVRSTQELLRPEVLLALSVA